MKIYEFLIKYKFDYVGFKDKGFETYIQESLMTMDERKLLFLAQLMMNRSNIILLNLVETGLSDEVTQALDEILLELSQLINPRKNTRVKQTQLDQKFLSSLRDPITGEVSEEDRIRLENRKKRLQFKNKHTKLKPTLIHLVENPRRALVGYYDRILVFRKGKLCEDIDLTDWESDLSENCTRLRTSGNFWELLDESGK